MIKPDNEIKRVKFHKDIQMYAEDYFSTHNERSFTKLYEKMKTYFKGLRGVNFRFDEDIFDKAFLNILTAGYNPELSKFYSFFTIGYRNLYWQSYRSTNMVRNTQTFSELENEEDELGFSSERIISHYEEYNEEEDDKVYRMQRIIYHIHNANLELLRRWGLDYSTLSELKDEYDFDTNQQVNNALNKEKVKLTRLLKKEGISGLRKKI